MGLNKEADLVSRLLKEGHRYPLGPEGKEHGDTGNVEICSPLKDIELAAGNVFLAAAEVMELCMNDPSRGGANARNCSDEIEAAREASEEWEDAHDDWHRCIHNLTSGEAI
tara:strand:+ start:2429 stop:2761 length:333 start_codon:yes stop_codon:yes gene_type:complete